MAFVYRVRNLTNDKSYVGITRRSVEQRWQEHCRLAMAGRGEMPLLAAIRKHGAHSFEVSILEECDILTLGEREKHWISALETFIGDGKGYNGTHGGDGGVLGHRHTEETRRKMGESRRGERNPNFGKRWGFRWEDHPERLAQFSAERIGEGNPMFGRHHRDESRQRIGQASALHKRKAVVQCDPSTGEELNTYPSMIEAAKAVGGQQNKISEVCCGRRKTHKKFKWKISDPRERVEV